MAKKILIVEDEEFISNMYKIKFDLSGYETMVADDGEKALKLAGKEMPDLILLDIMLPKMNGYEVLKRLKADEATKNIKVFMLSNLGQTGEVDKGFTDGADGFMIKADMTPAQLVKNVEKIFDGQATGVKRPLETKEAKGQPEQPREKIGKVLLVEDSDILGGMYKLGIEKAGFEVEIAKNGAWGLKLANTKKFDIIIMDMVMPAMDGYEAIKNLKAEKTTKRIPVIILSNSAQDQEVAEAKKLGAASYLLKSQITPSKLAEEIKNNLTHNN